MGLAIGMEDGATVVFLEDVNAKPAEPIQEGRSKPKGEHAKEPKAPEGQLGAEGAPPVEGAH